MELDKPAAEELLYGTAPGHGPPLPRPGCRLDRRQRGHLAIGDEADALGFRTNVPWYQTIGREYVRRMFRLARRHDPHATLVLNEFGFETTNEFGDDPVARQEAILSVIDACRSRTSRWTRSASRPTCSPRTGTASTPGSTGSSSSGSPTAA